MLNISGKKRDIINGKIQDNALSVRQDGGVIEIRYNPDNKTSYSNDGKSSKEIVFNRDPNHIERVEYLCEKSNGEKFSMNLDISCSSSDISTLDACDASDLKLMEMSQVEPDFERVKQKILESRKKQEVCSYIADRNHLERPNREMGEKDLNLGGKC